jgi:hypothetical protein
VSVTRLIPEKQDEEILEPAPDAAVGGDAADLALSQEAGSTDGQGDGIAPGDSSGEEVGPSSGSSIQLADIWVPRRNAAGSAADSMSARKVFQWACRTL